jgi:ketopantoate reductase
MVPFNVVHERPATFLRTTSGDLVVDADPALDPLMTAAGGVGLTLRRSPDMHSVHAAKLLLNLNNAVNALSGRPLKDQLGDRDFRRVLAASQREALAALAAAGLTPARITPLPASAAVALNNLTINSPRASCPACSRHRPPSSASWPARHWRCTLRPGPRWPTTSTAPGPPRSPSSRAR